MSSTLHPKPTDGSPAFENLELLYIVCDRFSHMMRTHLGVSLGVIEDLLQGYEVGKEDFLDSKNALHSVLGILDSVRELANKPDFVAKKQELSPLLLEVQSAWKASYSDVELLQRSNDMSSEVYFDFSLLSRALRTIYRYLATRVRDGSERQISFEVSKGSETTAVNFSFQTSIDSRFTRSLSEVSDFRTAARRDHSAESLGLLFAGEVFRLHGGGTKLSLGDNGRLSLSAWISSGAVSDD